MEIKKINKCSGRDPTKQKRPVFGIIFFIFLSFSTLFSQITDEKVNILSFDAGSDLSLVEEFYVGITENDAYKSDKKFGWLIKPVNSFSHQKLVGTGLRNDMTRDGVSGKKISFSADLSPGKWFITFWLDAGYENIPTAKIKLNNKYHPVVWHNLKESSEGRNSQLDNYRVIHTNFELKEDSFEFELEGENDSIRLLGFTIIPYPVISTEVHKNLFKVIQEAGKYRSTVNLIDLKLSLHEYLTQFPRDPFLFYWLQQVSLLYEAERYQNTMGWEWFREISHQSIFDRMHQSLLLLDAQIENFNSNENPLRERAIWNRGKICYDLVLERGGNYQRKIAQEDLRELYRIYPDDITLKMFNGEKIDFQDYCDNLIYPSNAPPWSILQREVICRLTSEINWWVNERQAPNGEFGGKIGDDVELLRWWTPFMLLGNKTAIYGWEKLAEAVWNSPKVYQGYSKRPIDVEHSAEFISDSTPELVIVDEDSTYLNRLKYTADYFKNLWTVKNKYGRRYFKSAWFSSTEVDERPPRNRDLEYNSRAVKALRYLAWATREKEYINLLSEWSAAWLHAALRTDKGKPQGLFPASVRGYDEALNGDELTWYEANMFWPYFEWESNVGAKMLDQLLFSYTLTGNDSLLLPIELSLEMIKNNYNKDSSIISKGSAEWAAKKLISNKTFWSVISRWRIITGNFDFDDIILKYGEPYIKYKLTKDDSHILSGLQLLLDQIRYNTLLRTDFVVHTDRVRTFGTNLLKAMISGDGNPEGNSPYFAVSWENTDENFTAFVTQNSNDYLEIQIFLFSENTLDVNLRLWELKSGNYDVSLNSEDEELFNSVYKIESPGQRMEIRIPGNQFLVLYMKKLK